MLINNKRGMPCTLLWHVDGGDNELADVVTPLLGR
jgi:hypothetical protein